MGEKRIEDDSALPSPVTGRLLIPVTKQKQVCGGTGLILGRLLTCQH